MTILANADKYNNVLTITKVDNDDAPTTASISAPTSASTSASIPAHTRALTSASVLAHTRALTSASATVQKRSIGKPTKMKVSRNYIQ